MRTEEGRALPSPAHGRPTVAATSRARVVALLAAHPAPGWPFDVIFYEVLNDLEVGVVPHGFRFPVPATGPMRPPIGEQWSRRRARHDQPQEGTPLTRSRPSSHAAAD